MMTIDLKPYSPMISSKVAGGEIYTSIEQALKSNQVVQVDFGSIQSMATFCAKQIFGKLYLDLGAEKFFSRVILIGANEDIKLIVKAGIESALDEV